MALQSIKNIIENKGYLIEQKDRAIFETGDLSSFFGFSENDAIEFIIYDANDNQLPQINGELVRYIPLSTQNINDYFLIPDGTVFQKYKLPKEYFIDAERLLRESGYNNGIFKTQISLINKRVGSESKYDRMWISEISPSRTEIRLFPLKRNQPTEIIKNLEERFKTFVDNKKFREDFINQAFAYIEQINPSLVGSFLKSKYGDEFFNTLVNEYKIQSFDIFVSQIYNAFMEAILYEFTNRISDVNNINYGKPKKTKPSVTITDYEIKGAIQRVLVSILNKYLPNPDIVSTSTFDVTTESSLDEIGKIIQKTTSDLQIDSGEVNIKKIGIIEKPKETEKIITLKEKIKKQLPILIEQDSPPPIIATPVEETPIVDSPPVFQEIPIDVIPKKPFPKIEIPQPDVIFQPWPETDGGFVSPINNEVMVEPTPIVTPAGGGRNRNIGIVMDERGVDFNEYLNNQIQQPENLL